MPVDDFLISRAVSQTETSSIILTIDPSLVQIARKTSSSSPPSNSRVTLWLRLLQPVSTTRFTVFLRSLPESDQNSGVEFEMGLVDASAVEAELSAVKNTNNNKKIEVELGLMPDWDPFRKMMESVLELGRHNIEGYLNPFSSTNLPPISIVPVNFGNLNLSSSQRAAIEIAINFNELGVRNILGPPGAGKTEVLVSIGAFLPGRILFTPYQNSASDNALVRCISLFSSIPIVRLRAQSQHKLTYWDVDFIIYAVGKIKPQDSLFGPLRGIRPQRMRHQYAITRECVPNYAGIHQR